MIEFSNCRKESNKVLRLIPYAKCKFMALLLVGGALSFLSPTVQAADLLNEHAGAIKPVTSLQNLPNFVNLVKQVKPAVVSITTQVLLSNDEEPMNGFPNFNNGDNNNFGPFPFFMFPQQMPKQIVEARGSGFLISPDGFVVTNNHVVKGAKKITVSLQDGSKFQAKVIGRDSKTDLALLKIGSEKPFPFIQLGDSNGIEPGEWVIAVGDPYGLGGTVTAGIVSARGRDIGDGPYDSFIQIDAPINRGNSGGPLFSQDGKVIGVNTAILSPSGGSIGIGFAIPSNTVKNVIGQLEKNGHVTRGYLGVAAQEITHSMIKALKLPETAHDMSPQGALIASVSPNSPAEKGGIKVGDVILSMNEKAISNPRDLAVRVAATVPGTSTNFKIMREGSVKELKVTIANLAEENKDKRQENKSPSNLGIALSPLTPELRQQIGVDDKVKGVVISGINRESPADRVGLQLGDIIVSVDNQAVDNPNAAVNAVKSALKKDTTVLLRIIRGNQSLFVPVDTKNEN
ncbi:Periplasmic serine endoprotease DegP [Commensalibacter sp. Nvir]|uniref:Do family serine endopeptidase n=1 Tax=Commensalibacter sp. Nvir TaxID=3069817 RepID=UPI002D44BCA6|nr:Periplasmic serine endoprotease DegP [Commensalibacter sp. Nvir]